MADPLGLALLVVALPLRALRWQYLFSAETRPPYRPVLYATILGQLFNNILPARAGEAARVVALSVGANVSTAETSRRCSSSASTTCSRCS